MAIRIKVNDVQAQEETDPTVQNDAATATAAGWDVECGCGRDDAIQY
jgi:hypothetical protein